MTIPALDEVTQARTVDEIPIVAREAIRLSTDEPLDEIDVQ